MKKVFLLGLIFLILDSSFFNSSLFAQTPVNELIGTNARAKDQVNEQLRKFSLVREYHGWESDVDVSSTGNVECEVGPLKWNPTADPTDFTNFDDFYSDFNSLVFPVLKSTNYKMRGLQNYDEVILEQKPYCQGYSPVNPTEGFRDGEIKPIPINAESQYFLDPPLGGVALWLDPMFGAAGELVEVNLRCSGFSDVSSFDINLGFASSWFELPYGENPAWHAAFNNLAVPNFNNSTSFNLHLNWTNGGTNLSIPDGEILLTFDFMTAQMLNSMTIQFVNTNVNIANFPVEVLTEDRAIRMHSADEVNYFIYSGTTPFDSPCPANYCFELWSTGFQAVTSSGINIVWDTEAYTYQSAALVSGLPNASDFTIDESLVGDGVLSINAESSGINWNALTQIADICLIPTCMGAPDIALNQHGSVNSQLDPETWREHALWVSAFATRFGGGFNSEFANSVYPNLLASQETPITGIGGITFVENSNEPDKSWYDNLSSAEYAAGLSAWHFSPEQYALMSSVDFDGHNSTVKASTGSNINIGVKNVNPNVQMVMGGLSGLKIQYIQQMVDWAVINRANNPNAIIPFDVVNVHHYCTSSSAGTNIQELDNDQIQINPSGHAIPPEEDGLKEKLDLFLASVASMHPEMESKEYWITEFGYDSHPQSPNAALPDMDIMGTNARDIDYDAATEEVKSELEKAAMQAQADWLVRYYLAISAAEGNGTSAAVHFNRACSFDIVDGFDEYIPGLFTTSGLLYGDRSPKKVWFWVMTLKNVLEGYSFNNQFGGISNCNDSDSRAYLYTSGGQPDIYTIWDTDSDGIDNEDCQLTFPLGGDDLSLLTTKVITFENGDENGKRRSLQEYFDSTPENESVSGNAIIGMSIKETPIFIIPNDDDNIFPPDSEAGDLSCPNMTRLKATSCQGAIYEWNWDASQGPEIDHYQIYTYSFPGGGGIPPAPEFDLSDRNFRLVADNIPGMVDDGTGTMVPNTGATFPIETVCAYDWVYLVATNVNGVVYEVCPQALAKWNPCSCAVDIEQQWYEDGAGNTLADEMSILFDHNDLYGSKCNLQDGLAAFEYYQTQGSNWPFDEDELILDFYGLNPIFSGGDGLAIKVNFFQFFDASGTGPFRIFGTPVDEDGNPGAEILLVDYIANRFAEWQFFPNNEFLDMEFGMLRFDNPTHANIQKIIICGQVAEPGQFFTDAPDFPEYESDIDPDVNWLNETFVELSWGLEYQFYNTAQTGRVPVYNIAYSDQQDNEGNLLEPEVIEVPDDKVSSTFTTTIDVSGFNRRDIKFDISGCSCYRPPSNDEFRLREPADNLLNVYPNPTNGLVTMVYKGKSLLNNFQVIDLNGQVLITDMLYGDKNWTIDLSNLAAGIYFIKTTSDDGDTILKKVVLIQSE